MEQNSLKKVTYALVAVAVILAGVLAYIWIQKSSLVSELQEEKQELTDQMLALQSDYATLSSDYDATCRKIYHPRRQVFLLVRDSFHTDYQRSRIHKVRAHRKRGGRALHPRLEVNSRNMRRLPRLFGPLSEVRLSEKAGQHPRRMERGLR